MSKKQLSLCTKLRKVKKTLKILGFAILAFLGIQVAAVAYLCYELSDDRLHVVVQDLLTSVLETEVKVEHVSLKPLSNAVAIYGFNVKDRQQQDMLHVDTLTAEINLWRLINNEVIVKEMNLAGATAVLYKENKDADANYQFAVDALHFQGEKKKKDKKTDLILDLRKISVSRTSAKWDVLSEEPLNTPDHKQLDANHLWVHNLTLELSLQGGGRPGLFMGKLNNLTVDEHNSNSTIALRDIHFDGKKKHLRMDNIQMAYQDKRLEIQNLKADYSGDIHPDSVYLDIKAINFENGIGVPERPFNPRRGAFDAKHLKLSISLQAAATHISPDSLSVNIHSIKGHDDRSGLALDDLHFTLYKNRTHAWVKDFVLLSGKSSVRTNDIMVTLPKYGKEKHAWSFETGTVNMETVLQELSHAFTISLQNFTTPLYATTRLHGNPEVIEMHNIDAHTADRGIQVRAEGKMVLPKKKGEKVDLYFDVKSMNARNKAKQQILAHFIKKKNTLDFMREIGGVNFRGQLHIPYRKVYIKGNVGTQFGSINADVLLNSETAFMTGKIAANEFDLGKYLDNKNIGAVSVKADVKMDIASKRKAKILHRTRGKIPMGHLKGTALTASYLGLKLKNIDFDIVSDAKTAKGSLGTRGKGLDVSCDFSFDDADIKHSLKVKPHVKVKVFN